MRVKCALPSDSCTRESICCFSSSDTGCFSAGGNAGAGRVAEARRKKTSGPEKKISAPRAFMGQPAIPTCFSIVRTYALGHSPELEESMATTARLARSNVSASTLFTLKGSASTASSSSTSAAANASAAPRALTSAADAFEPLCAAPAAEPSASGADSAAPLSPWPGAGSCFGTGTKVSRVALEAKSCEVGCVRRRQSFIFGRTTMPL
mmetsp:Transcript_99855/g.173280  ORF Transcript_99855/g.173280 Transcript_99855/m.173280 type:complete len:208 (+) Transcript_99855:1500-2123(+)